MGCSIILKDRSVGWRQPKDSDIEMVAIPKPTAGQVLTRTFWLLSDPRAYGHVGGRTAASLGSQEGGYRYSSSPVPDSTVECDAGRRIGHEYRRA
jgi:hypothetical protein